VFEFDAQVFDGPTEQAGDVHLAHAYVVRDLGLRLALVEAETQDLLLLSLEAVDSLLQQQPVLQALYLGPVIRLQVDDSVPLRLVLANGCVETRRVVGPPEGQSLGDAFHVGVEDISELLQRRRPSRPHGLVPDHLFRRLA
jgi:hypothetical protein